VHEQLPENLRGRLCPNEAVDRDMAPVNLAIKEPTRAYALFKKLSDKGASDLLQSFATSVPKTFEDETLEFKSGYIKNDDIDKIWSKNLGAFANNQGGVLVWGITADRDKETGIDAANALSLVPQPDVLKQRLLEKYQFLTEPVLVGTEVVSIPAVGDAGFVVCFIPEGQHKPYKSMRASRPYYIRINDDSVEVPHTFLRQLFAPRHSVKFALAVSESFKRPTISNFTFRFNPLTPNAVKRVLVVTVQNVGESSAKDVYISLEADGYTFHRLVASDTAGVFNVQDDTAAFLVAPVLHPSMKQAVDILGCSNSAETRTLTATIFAEHAAPYRVTLQLSGSTSGDAGRILPS
jgi:hypothetical protein